MNLGYEATVQRFSDLRQRELNPDDDPAPRVRFIEESSQMISDYFAEETELMGKTSNVPIDSLMRTGSNHLAITTDIVNAYSANPKVCLFSSGTTPIETAAVMPHEMHNHVHQNGRTLDWYCESHKGDPLRTRAAKIGERIDYMPVGEKSREALWGMLSNFLSILKVTEMVPPQFEIGDFNSIHRAVVEAHTMTESSDELQSNMSF